MPAMQITHCLLMLCSVAVVQSHHSLYKPACCLSCTQAAISWLISESSHTVDLGLLLDGTNCKGITKGTIQFVDCRAKSREEERLKRIRDEGYDRFAAINETNRPPDSVPSKRPPIDSDSD